MSQDETKATGPMLAPGSSTQLRTLAKALVLSIIGSTLVVCIGLNARPGFSDLPQAHTVSAGKPASWARTEPSAAHP